MSIQFGDIIKEIRLSRGLSQEEFASLLGTTKQVISRYETGQRFPKITVAQEYANKLNIPLAQLLGEDAATPKNILPLPDSRSYPLLGNIACGEPILAEENIREYIQFPEDIDADFCLRCKGDSMINARILDGDIVLIRKQSTVENGEIAAVRVGDEATLKRVYYTPGSDRITLRPCNPLYPDMEYEGERLSEIEIIGKAVSFISSVN